MPFPQLTSGLSDCKCRNLQALEKFSRVNESLRNLKNTRESQKLLTEVKTPAHWEEGSVDQRRLPIPGKEKEVLRIVILRWSSSKAYPTFPWAQEELRVLPRLNSHIASVKIL